MCRLLAFVSRRPVSLAGTVGSSLVEFTELSRRHGDGWGMAWQGDDDGLQVRRAPEAAYGSAEYAHLVNTVRTRTLVIHLRWATLGYPVSMGNTHPFTADDVAFAHNGSIKDDGALTDSISVTAQRFQRGTTDSERYFLNVLSRLESEEPERALRLTVEHIKARLSYTSLNCLLLTATSLYALAEYDGDYASKAGEPDYFLLRYLATGDRVVVGSQGWPQPDWSTLPNGHLLTIRRDTLETSVIPLAISAVA